jgi:hypothetical protein
MASAIVGAELHQYEGGHTFFAQDPRSVPDVIEFLSRDSPSIDVSQLPAS